VGYVSSPFETPALILSRRPLLRDDGFAVSSRHEACETKDADSSG
jgi:hypothetical protein